MKTGLRVFRPRLSTNRLLLINPLPHGQFSNSRYYRGKMSKDRSETAFNLDNSTPTIDRVTNARKYRSKVQRPCDLCRSRKVHCNIPYPSQPCTLCERTRRSCTFVEKTNRKPSKKKTKDFGLSQSPRSDGRFGSTAGDLVPCTTVAGAETTSFVVSPSQSDGSQSQRPLGTGSELSSTKKLC